MVSQTSVSTLRLELQLIRVPVQAEWLHPRHLATPFDYNNEWCLSTSLEMWWMCHHALREIVCLFPGYKNIFRHNSLHNLCSSLSKGRRVRMKTWSLHPYQTHHEQVTNIASVLNLNRAAIKRGLFEEKQDVSGDRRSRNWCTDSLEAYLRKQTQGLEDGTGCEISGSISCHTSSKR